jgi:hypothetical protein
LTLIRFWRLKPASPSEVDTMDTAAEFRTRANEYRRLAEVTVDPEDKRFRFAMAEYFERAASREEQQAASEEPQRAAEGRSP